MKKLFFSLSVLLLYSFMTSGCSLSPTTDTSSTSAPIAATIALTAEQIIENTTKAMQEVKIYRVSVTSSISSQGGQNPDAKVPSTGSGTIDLANHAFGITNDSTMESKSITTPSIQTITIYMLDNIVYVFESWVQGGWSNHPAGPDDWKQISYVDIQKASGLLEGSTVKTISQEIVDGISCYAFDVNPDIKKLFNMLSQPGAISTDAESISYYDNISKAASLKMWISKSNSTLTKLEYKLDLKFAPQDLGKPAGGTDIKNSIQVIARFSDYNQASPVVVPIEAVNFPTP